jgi:FkbM family methyltransferase
MRRCHHVVAAAMIALGMGLGCPATDDRDDILGSGESLYSQYNEELIIRHFFADRRGGFFVDVGSYHWKNQSTTYYLEKHLGWTGIAIDALGHFAAGYEQHRPGTRFYNYIVTDHSGTMGTLYFAGPLSSTQSGHAQDVYEWMGDPDAPEHPSKSRVEAVREAWQEQEDRRLSPSKQVKPREIQVPTITLTEILDQNGVSKIDFLSMDIEKGEPAALAGFDIKRFRPEFVCIEAFPPVQNQIAAYFESQGYERIDEYREYDDLNWYYKPKDLQGPSPGSR